MIRSGGVEVGKVVFFKFGVPKLHGSIKVLLMDPIGNILGGLDSLHQWCPHDFVLADRDDRGRRRGRHIQDGTHSLHTLKCREPPVICARRTASLSVAQHGHSGIQAQTLGKNVFDGIAGDLVQMTVLRSFGDDDNCASLPTFFPVLFHPILVSTSNC